MRLNFEKVISRIDEWRSGMLSEHSLPVGKIRKKFPGPVLEIAISWSKPELCRIDTLRHTGQKGKWCLYVAENWPNMNKYIQKRQNYDRIDHETPKIIEETQSWAGTKGLPKGVTRGGVQNLPAGSSQFL